MASRQCFVEKEYDFLGRIVTATIIPTKPHKND